MSPSRKRQFAIRTNGRRLSRQLAALNAEFQKEIENSLIDRVYMTDEMIHRMVQHGNPRGEKYNWEVDVDALAAHQVMKANKMDAGNLESPEGWKLFRKKGGGRRALPVKPRDGGSHTASAPGQPPAQDQGGLMAAQKWRLMPSKRMGVVFNSARAAGYLENGTSLMKPRPFYRPAFAIANAEFKRTVEGILARAAAGKMGQKAEGL